MQSMILLLQQREAENNRRSRNETGAAAETVTPFYPLVTDLAGQNPMLAMNVDKGALAQAQSRKNPCKLDIRRDNYNPCSALSLALLISAEGRCFLTKRIPSVRIYFEKANGPEIRQVLSQKAKSIECAFRLLSIVLYSFRAFFSCASPQSAA